MKVSQKFQVNHPRSLVWDVLADISLVAECLPGAELSDADGSETYKGKMKVKVGGFLEEDAFEFDALFFGISPKEATSMCMLPLVSS